MIELRVYLELFTAETKTSPSLKSDSVSGVQICIIYPSIQLFIYPSIHLFSYPAIYPSIHPLPKALIPGRVTGNLKSILYDYWHKVGDTIDGVPLHYKT